MIIVASRIAVDIFDNLSSISYNPNYKIMPFKKITSGANKGKYRSPSGRIFTEAQVRMYYATNRFTEKPKSKK